MKILYGIFGLVRIYFGLVRIYFGLVRIYFGLVRIFVGQDFILGTSQPSY